MAESKVHCLTCGHPILEGKDHPHYFAQVSTRPEADDAENFLAELRDLTGYLEVLFILLSNADNSGLDEDDLYHSHGLGWALATEARRRVELARGALARKEEQLTEEATVRNQAQNGKGA